MTDYVLLAVGLVLLAIAVFALRTPPPTQAAQLSAPVRLDRFFTPVLSLVYSVAVFGLIAGAVALCQIDWPRRLIQLILLNRYALLAGAFLIGLVPLALLGVPGLLRSLFVLRRPSHLFNVTWISLVAAGMVLLTTRVAEFNAVARYQAELELGQTADPVGGDWGPLRWLLVALYGLPIPLACLRYSLLNRGDIVRWPFWASLVLGAVFGLGLFVLAAASQDVLVPEGSRLENLFPFAGWLAPHLPDSQPLSGVWRLVAGVVRRFGHGYAEQPPGTDDWVLRPGHAEVLIGVAVALAVYLLSYAWVLATRWTPTENFWFPPLFFVLLVVIVVGFLLQALAFWLDLYHIPVSLAVVGFSALLFLVNRTDHFFDLKSSLNPVGPAAQPPVAAPAAPTLDQVAQSWKLPPASLVDGRDGCKTLVVVTAAGGGIQAAAWGARVLVGLHELYGDALSGSIGLISAVSGGAVGSLYYLDQWASRARPFAAPALAACADGRPKPGSIRWNAQQSSLEATAWGVAFPDLLRTFFPPLVFRTDDRGARIEDAWRARMTQPGARFADWATRMAAGDMPVVVFNATVVETGQRLTASPVLKRPPDPNCPPGATQARELLELYPRANPLASTAVRLSATFAYVSPICRPLEVAGDDPRNDYHFCDGGYVDNEGMATAIDWLLALFDKGCLDPAVRRSLFDQILFIRISPFPIERQAAPAELNGGWLYATLGPLEALQNVRVASQAERNSIAVGLFIEAAQAQGVPVRSALFDFRPAPDAGPTPLSWMLTEDQKREIDAAWQRLVETPSRQDPLGTVDQVFRRVSGSPPEARAGMARMTPGSKA